MSESNPIVDFVKQGKNLASQPGIQLLKDAEEEVLKEAVKNPDVQVAFLPVFDDCQDVYLRRKLLKVLAN